VPCAPIRNEKYPKMFRRPSRVVRPHTLPNTPGLAPLPGWSRPLTNKQLAGISILDSGSGPQRTSDRYPMQPPVGLASLHFSTDRTGSRFWLSRRLLRLGTSPRLTDVSDTFPSPASPGGGAHRGLRCRHARRFARRPPKGRKWPSQSELGVLGVPI